jgi:hypothetical protein
MEHLKMQRASTKPQPVHGNADCLRTCIIMQRSLVLMMPPLLLLLLQAPCSHRVTQPCWLSSPCLGGRLNGLHMSTSTA